MMKEISLNKSNRIRLAQAFRDAPHIDLGIDCVIEGQMGQAFTDEQDNPAVFMIGLGGLFCYFAGQSASPAARHLVQELPAHRLLMPSAPGWIDLVKSIHPRSLIPQTRYSFSSDSLLLPHLQKLMEGCSWVDRIRSVDVPMAGVCRRDPQSLIEISDYDSGQDFVERSIGYYAMDGDVLAGVAYGSLVCSRGIEVSIFVEPQYRRKGLSTCLACALLIYCLKHRMEPHWDAANLESCHLAEKLGYIPVGTYEAFYYPGA